MYEYKQKTSKHFLKVVQGNALSLMSTIAILPITKKGLQLLNLNFGKVLVSKRFPLAIGGGGG